MTESMNQSSEQTTYRFSSDIQQLMSLIINTFYSNKAIFLRELISNASDALDKIRYQSLTNSELLGEQKEFKIEIIPDKESNCLVIRDTGIGMTKEDMINNLGTIARSGTKAFMEAISAGADVSMIGQFGVGFYSSFLVADRVTVYSKHNDDACYVWESTADGQFTVQPASAEKAEQLKRGCEITLHLKEDQKEYLEEKKIKDLVKRHSQYITHPIYLQCTKEVEKDVSDDEDEAAGDEDKIKEVEEVTGDDEKEEKEDEDQIMEVKDDEDDEKDGEKKKEKKKIKELVEELERLNSMSPVWARKESEVSEKEYTDFYKNLTNDWEDYLAMKRFEVEGQIEFQAVLFVPKRPPFDMFDKEKKQNNIQLYVRNVFITEDSIDLCPEYLRFVKGVVSATDIPLNISREHLQQNKIFKVIRKQIIKKTLEMLEDLAEDDEKFKQLLEGFGKYLKLGIHEDSANRLRLAKLLRFHTSNSETEQIGFMKYIERMKENQPAIYYITGDSVKSLNSSPFIERLRKRNYEVIYMVDPIDEYAVQQLKEIEGKKLMCVTKENLDLGLTEEEKKAAEDEKKSFEVLCKCFKDVTGNQFEKVVTSDQMTDSPCSVVTSEFGYTANMQKTMKRQPLQSNMMNSYMYGKMTLLLNPKNNIMCEMKKKAEADPKDPILKDLIFLVRDTALLSSGFELEDPGCFSGRIYKLIRHGMSIYEDDMIDDDVPPLEGVDESDAKEAENVSLEEVD